MPTLYYHAYSHQHPSGGQLDTYAHVAELNRRKMRAVVVHDEPDFRLNWVSFDVPILDLAEARARFEVETDFWVLPEDMGWEMDEYVGRKVVFNKGVYLGFAALGLEKPGSHLYNRNDIAAAFVVSEHNARYLRYAFPRLPVHVIPPFFDHAQLHFRHLHLKQRVIACAAKAPIRVHTLYQLLTSRAEQGLNELSSFKWIRLTDLAQRELIQTLQDAYICVFLGTEEGLSRLPVEAMACGCMLIATNTGSLAPMMPREYQFAPDDIISMAEQIERLAERFRDRSELLGDLQRRGREVADRLSIERFTGALMKAWGEVVGASEA